MEAVPYFYELNLSAKTFSHHKIKQFQYFHSLCFRLNNNFLKGSILSYACDKKNVTIFPTLPLSLFLNTVLSVHTKCGSKCCSLKLSE